MIYNQEIDDSFLNGLVVGCVLLFIHWLWLFIHSICRWNCHPFLLDIASHNHKSFVSVISEKNEVSLCYHTIKFVESMFFFGMIWITNNEKKSQFNSTAITAIDRFSFGLSNFSWFLQRFEHWMYFCMDSMSKDHWCVSWAFAKCPFNTAK